MASIHIDTSKAIKDLKNVHSGLSKKVFGKKVIQALNHTIRKTKTEASKEIRKTYGGTASVIKKSLHLRLANFIDPSAIFIARGKRLPLMAFRPRKTKTGVSVRLKGKSQKIHGAFIQTMPSGHTGVFAKGQYSQGKFKFRKKRRNFKGNDLRINELKTIAVPMAVSNKIILTHLQDKMVSDFPARLKHLLSRT